MYLENLLSKICVCLCKINHDPTSPFAPKTPTVISLVWRQFREGNFEETLKTIPTQHPRGSQYEQNLEIRCPSLLFYRWVN